jgi:hypothetical protein
MVVAVDMVSRSDVRSLLNTEQRRYSDGLCVKVRESEEYRITLSFGWCAGKVELLSGELNNAVSREGFWGRINFQFGRVKFEDVC